MWQRETPMSKSSRRTAGASLLNTLSRRGMSSDIGVEDTRARDAQIVATYWILSAGFVFGPAAGVFLANLQVMCETWGDVQVTVWCFLGISALVVVASIIIIAWKQNDALQYDARAEALEETSAEQR